MSVKDHSQAPRHPKGATWVPFQIMLSPLPQSLPPPLLLSEQVAKSLVSCEEDGGGAFSPRSHRMNPVRHEQHADPSIGYLDVQI
jgi:hypothetical protein